MSARPALRALASTATAAARSAARPLHTTASCQLHDTAPVGDMAQAMRRTTTAAAESATSSSSSSSAADVSASDARSFGTVAAKAQQQQQQQQQAQYQHHDEAWAMGKQDLPVTIPSVSSTLSGGTRARAMYEDDGVDETLVSRSAKPFGKAHA